MKASTEQDYRERMLRSLLYVQQHLDDSLDLDELAGVAAFSRFHFHRIFRAMVGESLGEYVRRLRLERAARCLKTQNEQVTQIAFQAGFETHESFTRAFKAMFGVSPSAYRTAHAPAPESASGTHFNNVSGYRPPVQGEPPVPEIKELAPMNIVFVRHVGPYSEVGAAWGRLMAWAGPRGLLGPETKMVGIVHDDPDVTPQEKIRYDACIVVTRPVAAEGDVGTTEIAGGAYAVFTHKGPYEDFGKTYGQIFGSWLPKSGYQLRDVPSFEQYLNSPQNTRPEDLVTLIYVPVAK
jgi:AraC family transcriptional regulator